MDSLYAPEECCLALIDYQPQMLFAVQSHDRQLLINNVVGLAKAAKAFNIPTILSTIGSKNFAGPVFPELQAVFPEQEAIDRTTMNAWEDPSFVEAIKATGRNRVIMAGLWTEICLVFPVMYALDDGYDVAFVADASGGQSVEAHHLGCDRMIQAGAEPLTWAQIMAEWQRDWARKETAGKVRDIALHHLGAYGQGLVYAQAMFKSQEGSGSRSSTQNIQPPQETPEVQESTTVTQH
jgi:nicotinamidase-related amidase